MGSLRYFNLDQIRKRFNTSVFFETGAGTGTGIEYAASVEFEHIYSVEIIESQATLLSRRFSSDKRISVICNRSDEALKEYLPKLSSNALFFLDAHFPGADLGLRSFDAEQDEDLRLPLFNELNIVKELRADKGFKDVILIDDIMIFDEDHIYPDNHLKQKFAIAPRKLINGYQQILDVLKDTHNYQIFPDYSGYVMIYPR